MTDAVIETKDLTKKYGTFTAVERLSLTVERGEIFGLLGPNGAGKTTTILMLLGLTEPTSGRVRVLGLDPARQPLSVKSRVGYLPDLIGFYDELSARENLIYTAKLNGISRREIDRRISESLARVGLMQVADHRVGTFSRGMRQRLGVADMLIKKPELIIMDEPTQGLDPEGARDFLKMILGLKQEGITVLVSSHLLPQVQATCDRVGLFHQGRMVMEGSVPDLARQVLGGAYRIHVHAFDSHERLKASLEKLPGVVKVNRPKENIYELEAESDVRPQVAQAVVQAGGKLLQLDIETQSLDEIYARYFQEVEHVSTS